MLTPQKIQAHLEKISHPDLPVVDFLKRNIFMYAAWLIGIPVFIYGVVERGVAAYQEHFTEVTLLSQCMIALVALFIWFIIGTATKTSGKSADQPRSPHPPSPLVPHPPLPLACVAEQRYRLPFSHRCQIFHLLNLKHLEDIHRVSLGNLKVTEVSQFTETQTGGRLRFKTVLDSPTNILRLWRDPSVEVELILHTPYQIELKVPAYNHKHIHVLFNVLPLAQDEHLLSIQIFSDLGWPSTVMRAILIVAASLTLLEDIPYLSQIATSQVGRSPRPAKGLLRSPMMQLFNRYLHLYERQWEDHLALPTAQ